MKKSFEQLAAELEATLPAGPRVGIIGGTSFWQPESRSLCTRLGGLLARLDGIVLLTGGVEGVGETVGRSFASAREENMRRPNVVHVVPRGSRRWDYGETHFAGEDMAERREVLGRLAGVYVAVEGGPGTAHEASVALARSAFVIPIGRSGGASKELYSRVTRPAFAPEGAWRTLAAADASPEQAAGAAVDVVIAYLGESKRLPP